MEKPQKPYPDFPLFAHATKRWAKKIKGKLVYFGPWDDPEGALAKFQASAKGNLPSSGHIVKESPEKPYRDFPLYAHKSGKWCVKIKGKSHYFGTWDDPEGALREFKEVEDDLRAGRVITRAGGATVRELCNRFLASKEKSVQSGELTQRSWDDYYNACGKIIKAFGKTIKIANLRPSDFEALRASLWEGQIKKDGTRKKKSPITVANDITRIRVVFKYAEKNRLTPTLIYFGESFEKPNAKAIRKAKLANGKKMFKDTEIRKMLEVASPQMKAMILLGVNCGFGNYDCALLTVEHIKDGKHDFPRPKTGVERGCPLWPETIEALGSLKWGEKHLFMTKYGKTWEPKSSYDNPISNETNKIMKKAGVYKPRRGFYALRYTFNSIGLRTGKKDAVKYIMGHTPSINDMTANYNQEAPPDRNSAKSEIPNY